MKFLMNMKHVTLLNIRLFSVYCVKMNSGNKGDHLNITAGQFRSQDIVEAEVKQIFYISPTVKKLCLAVPKDKVAFQPGQWVDFFIPGTDTVCGFSMCSSPHLLGTKGLLELAVKYSDYPPTLWVHTQCKPGSKVGIRVGGNFYHDLSKYGNQKDLLLIGGGVGINPLMSIVNTICDTPAACKPNVYLLYSSSTKDELLFKEDLQTLSATNPNIKCQFHITKENTKPTTSQNVSVFNGRITSSTVKEVLKVHFPDLSRLRCYLCGPAEMAESVEKILLQMNVTKEQIIYEKWW